MFYSRPKVDALGWDLTELPTPNGSKNFDAFTSDNRPVDFRFSGGWLTVEIGPADAPPDGPDMKEVLSIPISPFGTMDIQPEQICDILGLTVNGRTIDSAGTAIAARGFDWSGRTTYWESTHLMQPRGDAGVFIQKLRDAFRGSVLVQPEWGAHGRLRCRQIQFLMASDELAAVCIGPHGEAARALLAGERISTEEFERAFAYRIDFSREDWPSGDATGARYIGEHGARELGLDYSTISHRRYRVRTQFPTADAEAQARTKALLSAINTSFCRGLQVVNLQTGAVITENLEDGADKMSYSAALRDEWLTKRECYLFVGKSVTDDDSGWGNGIFWGARPIAGV